MLSKTIKVLLVEDNAGDARLVELALREAAGSFDIVHTERLGTALELLREDDFSAVLLDLSLPDSQGLDTVAQVKSVDPSVPIVVLSGLLDEVVALKAVQSGAQDYLVKGRGDAYLMARAIRYAMERKHAEDELRKSHDDLERRVAERTAALAESNQRLREEIAERRRADRELRSEHAFNAALFDTVGALIVVCDAGGRIVRFNRACERVTGYLAAEVYGRFLWDLFCDDGNNTHTLFAAVRAGDHAGTFEGYWTVRDGGRRFIAWSNTALADDSGGVEYFICCGNDITERQRLEEREKQRLMELAHLLRLNTLGEMTTEIAHELNQPLTAIGAYSNACSRLLQAGERDTTDIAQALRGISDQAQRAGEIIRRLRRFARKEKPEQVALDINALIREVLQLLQVGVRWKNITLEDNLSPALPRALADPVLVEQVIINLVRNAIDAMESMETRKPRLVLTTRMNAAGRMEVSVADNGPGLSPDVHQRIFEPFFTTKAGGMGVGLSLSRSIVEAHGGVLRLVDTEEGATFQFTLPVMDAAEGE